MLKKFLGFRVIVVMLLVLVLSCPAAFARGDDRGRDRGHDSRGDRGGFRSGEHRVYYGGDRHFYRDGRWYRHGWFGFDFIVSALVIGAIIDSLPPRHTTVVVEGIPYYYDNSYYYRAVPDGGYVVVPPPIIVQPQPSTYDTTTVNIPNTRGGYTSVTLKKSGTGYVGPQGEFYPTFPSVEQLKTMYGN